MLIKLLSKLTTNTPHPNPPPQGGRERLLGCRGNARHHSLNSPSQKGFTLIELAITLVITVLVGVSVSNLVLNAVTVQQSDRIHTTLNNAAMNVVEHMRNDLRLAQANSVSVSANQIQFNTFDVATSSTVAVTYTYTGTTITRTYAGNTKDMVAGYNVPMQIQCGSGAGACFTGYTPPTPASAPVQRIALNDLIIVDATPSNSTLDNAFGKAQFRVTNAAFNIHNGMQFQ